MNNMPAPIRFNFEHPLAGRLRCGFIGCGDHAYRNIYPAFRYLPLELVAVCDTRVDRAEAFARTFGAQRSTQDHRQILADPAIAAVFIVTNYDEHGHPRATALALEALKAGKHVWMEKPPAASVAELIELRQAASAAQRTVLVGFKKMFTPGVERLREIIDDPAFGGLSSIAVRYPQELPAAVGDDRTMIGFLDHIVHPGSILHALAGAVSRIHIEREAATGATVSTLRFASGVIGSLHLTAGQSGASVLERVEIVGRGSNAVLDNGCRLTWYRPGGRGAYGREPSFANPVAEAPLLWEPEFSLGNLANNTLFLLGYVQEIACFCSAVQAGRQPAKGSLDDAIAILRLYEAFRQPLSAPVTVGG